MTLIPQADVCEGKGRAMNRKTTIEASILETGDPELACVGGIMYSELTLSCRRE